MLFKIDKQHLARLQAPLRDDLLLRDGQDAHFGGKYDQVVVGDEIARGPETIAVERSADLAPIGERDRCGPVPRLHQSRVILVKRASLLVHQRISRPGFRDQHHHRMAQRISALDKELERIVEAGGVGLALIGDRPELRNIIAEQLRVDARLTRRHPVDVAPERVDLAVMRNHAIGVGKAPGWERVRGEALMDERQRSVVAHVQEIAVVWRELADQHHPLVDNGAGRQRDRVVFRNFRAAERKNSIGNDLADDEEPALKIIFSGEISGAADENLLHHRLGRFHAFAEP